MTKGFSNDSSGRTTTPTRTSTCYDGRVLQEAPTQALAQPPPAFLNFSMRSSRNSRRSYLVPRSGSRASIDTVCSTTPIRNSTWGPYEPEKGSDSGEDDVLRAINEDLEVLEPFEQDYHRQRPFWLFSMVWYVHPPHLDSCNLFILHSSQGLTRFGGSSALQSTFHSLYTSQGFLQTLLAPAL